MSQRHKSGAAVATRCTFVRPGTTITVDATDDPTHDEPTTDKSGSGNITEPVADGGPLASADDDPTDDDPTDDDHHARTIEGDDWFSEQRFSKGIERRRRRCTLVLRVIATGMINNASRSTE